MNIPFMCLLRKLCHLRRLTLGNVLCRLGKAKLKLPPLVTSGRIGCQRIERPHESPALKP